MTTDQQRLAKNKQIAATKKATKDRRSKMRCQVFHLKITVAKSSKQAQSELKQMFNQSKWLKNYILSLNNIDDYQPAKTVLVKTPTGFEVRTLDLLGSQIKQSIYENIKGDIRNLAKKKNKGHKVGKLKFARDVKSLNLKQVNSTYRFNKKFNKVKIQGNPNWYHIRGADQFNKLSFYELANAKLLKKADGYYLAVTVYTEKSNQVKTYPYDSLGVDFGIKTHLTLSDGRELNITIVETGRLKRLQRKLQRQEKRSNNYRKTLNLIQREYLKISRQKNEASNKIISLLKKEARIIYFQDDNFGSWKNKKSLSKGSKVIHHSILGRVKQKMLEDPSKFLKVGRYAPTSKTCICGAKNEKLSLSDRWFICSSCGYSAPRDLHAANNMKNFYTPGESGVALVERKLDFNGKTSKHSSMKQETDNFFHKG